MIESPGRVYPFLIWVIYFLMPESKQFYRSTISSVVIPGIVFILLVSGLFLALNARQAEVLSSALTESQSIAKKLDAVAELIEIARRRTSLTLQMAYQEDPFKRDEISLKLNAKASRFAMLRNRMMNGWLNEREKSILNGQGEYIRRTLVLQREAAELSFSDDEAGRLRGRELLVTRVYPLQVKLVNYFLALSDFLQSEEASLSQNAIGNLEYYKYVYRLMVLLVMLAAAALAFYMVKKIRAAEKMLAQEKEKAHVTLRSIDDAVISVNRDGLIEYINPKALAIFSLKPGEKIDCHVNEFLQNTLVNYYEQIRQCIDRILLSEGFITGIRGVHISPQARPEQVLSASISPIIEQNEQVSGLVISLNDITQADALLKKNQYIATHDVLTNLFNRRAFETQVKLALKDYDSSKGHMFCVIDLDQFKIVNDSAGHAAGDELLRQLANSMKPVFRKQDIFCRLGGDEFGVFLRDIDYDEAERIMQKLLDVVSSFAFSWKDNLYRISASIGMMRVDSGLMDYDYLFQAADLACYAAKNEGRNQMHYMPADADLLVQRSEEARRLKYLTQALEQGENLVLFEQAIVPISQRTEGRRHSEILLRMRGENGSIIPPMAFIPVAERYGLMSKVDCWVLRRVCEHILATPLDATIFAVNLSGQSLSSKEVMKKLVTIVFESRIPPGRLCIEVTETSAISNLEVARRFMIVLQEHGCYTALDDFGSGLSSFAYLSKMPLDYLKIDGVFIKSILTDKSSLAMVEAIHYVAKKMGLMTIAEYVEDEAMVQQLKKIGIDMAQGYYYDKPHELKLPALADQPVAVRNDDRDRRNIA
jgi:diguanylate cyclase (GGDEF)-like protein